MILGSSGTQPDFATLLISKQPIRKKTFWPFSILKMKTFLPAHLLETHLYTLKDDYLECSWLICKNKKQLQKGILSLEFTVYS
jgi:hypothetical protein